MAALPSLVLGPLLRYVGETDATVWVETDAACEVEVLGCRARTFQAHGRHYALVVVRDLEPGTSTRYEVRLDGVAVWPEPDSTFPPSVIRTTDPRGPFRLSFGSCRMTLAPSDVHPRGHGVDTLRALACQAGRNLDSLPDILLLAGDQVYADEVADDVRERVFTPGKEPRPPDDSVADYEEYARLYRIAWGEQETRWLLSTVSSAMIFDDHDVRDDWNTSVAWRREMAAQPWWPARIIGALGSYWIYQHLGNLSPAALAEDGLYATVLRADGDVGGLVDAFAGLADQETDSYRWSYARDAGNTRLVVIDTRAGRVVTDDVRAMADATEWDWCAEQIRTAPTHLLIGSSLPWLLPKPLHDLEGWNEAVTDGAWGTRWRGWGETIRQALDLEHWAAFRNSFDALTDLLHEVAARPDAPASVMVLSGDVHYSYLAEARFPDGARVWQVVCSPLRNPLGGLLRRANLVAFWRPFTVVGRALSKGAGVRDPRMRWQVLRGPWFDNALCTVETTGRTAGIRWQAAVEDEDGERLAELGSALLST